MRLSSFTAVLIVLALFAAAPGALAFEKMASSDEPIHVVADKLDVDNKNQVAIFSGAVKATQGDVTITSDRLEVYYDKDAKAKKKDAAGGEGLMDQSGNVRKVVALGHVRIKQKDRMAVGSKATYWAGGRRMLLEGKATVWRGKNQVSGEKITVYLDQDRSVVHGKPGKRVTVTITPGKKKK